MLGDQIKSIRMANKMSQVELARRLDISKQSVSNLENNNIRPSIDMLKKICGIFSCSADYLLELNDNCNLKLETANLTVEQVAHIQQLVNDLEKVNKAIMYETGKKANL